MASKICARQSTVVQIWASSAEGWQILLGWKRAGFDTSQSAGLYGRRSAKVLPLLRVKIFSSLSCNWLDSPWLYHDDCVCCRAAKNGVSVFAQKPRVVLKENSTSNWLTASSSFESPPISWRCLLKFRWTMQTFIHLFPLELEQWPWRIQLLRL